MSLEFATGDSTQPNGGLSHTGTPKPPGKEQKVTDPISWALGTSIGNAEKVESVLLPVHSKSLLMGWLVR